MRKIILFSILITSFLWQSCTSTKPAVYPEPVIGSASFDHWIHSPLHPHQNQPVHFKSAITDNKGITKVELYIYEYQLFVDEEGRPSKRRNKTSQWGLEKSWTYDQPVDTVGIDYLFEPGFKDFSNVEYIFKVYNPKGEITERMALFDAGKPLLGDEKILLYATTTQPLKETINLCFLPDTDYAKDWQGFLSDVESLIYNGYHTNNKIENNKGLWQFYYTKHEMDGAAIANDYYNKDLYPKFLKNDLIQGIDAFGLLHQLPYGDGTYLKRNIGFLSNSFFTSETYNHGTAIHETAHAVFNLSDEYNHCVCFPEGGNVFQNLTDCEAFNIKHGFPKEDCSTINHVDGKAWHMSEANVYFETREICEQYNIDNNLEEGSCQRFIDAEEVNWYRSLDGLCIMQDDGDAVVRDFKRTCSSVIDKYYHKLKSESNNLLAEQEEIQYNIYGYEKVVLMELNTSDSNLSFVYKGTASGVPKKSQLNGTSIELNFLDQEGTNKTSIQLADPTIVHEHEAHEHGATHDHTELIKEESVKYRFAVPYEKGIETMEYIYKDKKYKVDVNPAGKKGKE